MDDVKIWLLLATFAMAIAWVWQMAEVMAIKTRQRYKEEARKGEGMKREAFNKIKELLNERENIMEALQYKYIGIAYGDSMYLAEYSKIRCGGRTEELLKEALNRRLDEIKDELKELGLED